MEALRKMFVKLEIKAQSNQERNIVKDRFTVAEKMEQIKEVFDEADTIKFTDLFETDYNKSEIITTFQAMLELLKGQFFHAEIFGEILLHRVKGENNYDWYVYDWRNTGIIAVSFGERLESCRRCDSTRSENRGRERCGKAA